MASAHRFRILLIASVALALAASAASIAFPATYFLVVAPDLDLIVNTATTAAASFIALLAWIRFGETHQTESLFQASAFVVLAATGAIPLVLVTTGTDVSLEYSRTSPGQLPLYTWTLGRLVAGILLVVGALAALRGWHLRSTPVAWLAALIPALGVLATDALLAASRNALPHLVSEETLRVIASDNPTVDLVLVTPQMLLVQSAVGITYLLAAVAYGRWYSTAEGRRPYVAFLAVGLVIAALTQVRFAVLPGVHAGLFTSADALRLAVYAVILAGVAAASRHDLATLRRNNAELRELRQRDAERITLEERAGLARDVHDGLVQELWLARLAHGRLNQLDDLPAEARPIVQHVDGVLEAALGEARQAVITLAAPDATFASLLQRVVDDHADRFGLEVDCTIETEPPPLPERVISNALRICREALTNARKHANASLVRVTLASSAGALQLVVHDDGDGFDPEQRTNGFGMTSMRERAEMVGGTLHVESSPGNGTRVTLRVPIAPSGAISA